MNNELLEQSNELAKQGAENGIDALLNNPFVVFVGKLILAWIVLIIMIIASKIISWTIKRKLIKNSSLDNEEYVAKVSNLVWDIIFYILLIFSIFISFQMIWFDLTILLWWLSFWIWFAFKEILWNMLAGILVLTTKDYRIWDIVKVEWVAWSGYDYFWKIEEITIRYTSIREFNNQRVIIPNLVLITNPIKTFTSEENIRWESKISLSYKADIQKARNLIMEAINNQSYIIHKEKTNIIYDNFSPNWAELIIWYHYDPNGKMSFVQVKSAINDLILNTLKDNDIEISYPHTTLTVWKNDQNILKTILFAKK